MPNLIAGPNTRNRSLMLVVVLLVVIFGLSFLLFGRAANPRSDIDQNGVVNQGDINIMLADLGGSSGRSDLNADGRVNLIDVSILLSNYGFKTQAPPSSPPPLTDQTVIGLHTGARDIDYRATSSLRPKLVRVGGLSASMSRSEIQAIADQYGALQTRIIALVDFNGAPPSEADCRNLATWANVTGLEAIEFGNEPWIAPQYGGYFPETYNPGDPNDPYIIYASRFKVAKQAIEAANPKMILIAVGDSANTNHRPAYKTFQAMQAIGVKPSAIQIHPYGPRYMNRLDDAKRDLTAMGWQNNTSIWVTEVGVSSDNGRQLDDNYGWNKAMSYNEAGDVLRTVTAGLAAGGVKRIIIYMGTDYRDPGTSNNREYYFGLTQTNGSDKGSLSNTARQLFSQ